MKTINPSALQKVRNLGDALVRKLTLLFGTAAVSVFMVLFFFGGALYAVLAGFAAAAGVVHMFNGPTFLAVILGFVFAVLAMQPGLHLLLFIAAFFGAMYAWGWHGLVAFIVFMPGFFFIPLAVLAAAVAGFRGVSLLRRRR
ncbi:MAG: hypothetical protein EON60_05730 [Alphaproteobacteria bacterium]|nr:MAG: hypothetical protein EON60_05730 [Alphaproteobacteria bacterium]